MALYVEIIKSQSCCSHYSCPPALCTLNHSLASHGSTKCSHFCVCIHSRGGVEFVRLSAWKSALKFKNPTTYTVREVVLSSSPLWKMGTTRHSTKYSIVLKCRCPTSSLFILFIYSEKKSCFSCLDFSLNVSTVFG